MALWHRKKVFLLYNPCMKRDTLERRVQIANDIMFYIYTHIDTDIDIDALSRDLDVSRFHMQRVFKEVFGRNIYESIKSIRLQKASNLLLTNRYSTITDIAQLCGYSSQTSFIRAFKARFEMTPKAWRQGGYGDYSAKILSTSHFARTSQASFEHLRPEIVKMPRMQAYYIRHRGYNDAVRETWQKLQTWCFHNNITKYEQIALFHDNPTVTPLEECHYVACIRTDHIPKKSRYRLPIFDISDGIYARFDLQGVHGDVLKFIRWVYHEWLPQSDYETTTKPSYAVYRTNNYLDPSGHFDLSFYLSIRY
jgi:AraC family transcriptional regulator